MNSKFILLLLSALLLTAFQGCGPGWVVTDNSSANVNQNINYEDQPAYQPYNVNSLNQYGDWENYNSYGRVWRPSVPPGWQPFTNGHWAHDGYDWVWVSREPFGGMVYHYGSWENTPEYGWVWVPENDSWSPANVQWAYYDDQVCWAPRRAQNRNWSDPWEPDNMHPWVAVPMKDFNRDNVGQYRMNDIPKARTDHQFVIDRRQPNISVVRGRVNQPNQIYKIDRVPVQRNPVRNNVTPVERNPKTITPPVVRNPVDVRPPVDRKPVDVIKPVDKNPNSIVRPVDKNPKTITPPVTRNPNIVRPPVVKNQKTVTPPVRQINRPVVPPRDTLKIHPKKEPVKTVIKTVRPDTNKVK
jgi:hypothetical protein